MHRISGLLPYLFVSLVGQVVEGYDPLPRWGQSVTLAHDGLLVHGGKSDASNAASYTSAQSSNELLYLPLGTTFDITSPPWQLLGESDQSPSIAWHTLCSYDGVNFISFGGDPGPNSPTVLPGQADSAVLLRVGDDLTPTWSAQPQGWAGQPQRRIHHSSSSYGGKVYIIGGSKADGSSNGLSENYVFDPTVPSFTLLPTENGPGDITGHASLVTPSGQLLVFGGYSLSQTSMVNLSSIWNLDLTQPAASWTTIDATGANFPPPRRGFASVMLDDQKVLIHGGSDMALQESLSDGWVLDLGSRSWTRIDALGTLGARRDHFAVNAGGKILFGFGYGPGGGIASLDAFDISTSNFVGTFTPSTSGTQKPGQPGRPGGTSHTVPPLSTASPGGNPGEGKKGGSRRTGIALGSVFGFLGLAAGAALAVYYIRRRRNGGYWHKRRFHPVGGSGLSGDDESYLNRNIPVVTRLGVDKEAGGWAPSGSRVLNTLGLSGGLARKTTQRRDMLADEDTRHFSVYDRQGRRQSSTGSAWSLFSVFGGAQTPRPVRQMSREGSYYGSSLNTPRVEDREKGDPFADNAELLGGQEMNVGSSASAFPPRALHGYHQSYASSYTDPFADAPLPEYAHDLTLDDPPPAAGLRTDVARALSPVMERRSQDSRSNPGSSASTHDAPISPFLLSRTVSDTSQDEGSQKSPLIRPVGASIIGAAPNPPIRRSDSWWSRFAKTSFLDRRLSDGGRTGSRPLDFRDPNPAPRLITIEESGHSKPSSDMATGPRNIYSSLAHGRSVTSIQTADSEAIERMGAMDVVQRAGTIASHRSTKVTSPTREDSTSTVPLEPITTSLPLDTEQELYTSPVGMEDGEETPTNSQLRRKSIGGVAARIKALEGKTSEEAGKRTKRKEHPPTSYNLVPKAPLFVANPDHTSGRSSES